MLQQQWKQAGVDLKINNMAASAVFGDYMLQSKFELILIGQFVEPDVGLFSYPQFHSRQIPKETQQGRKVQGLRLSPNVVTPTWNMAAWQVRS